ncbi:hypothetical protein ACE1B6_22790 [Aerosakkonemataceae cyanobacterium BLCC-F154]|uniref:Uncharacterized protein n=1 Tax=Floridaenema fluviatile BLCC-F154 TaxID=3153640 RepID=A0ABV4YJS9_9CYAN
MSKSNLLQQDLLGLEISPGEIKHLTGIDPEDIFRPSILRDSSKKWSFWLNEISIALALTPILLGVIYVFIILPTRGASLKWAVLLIVLFPFIIVVGRLIWLKKHSPDILVNLLDEIDKYHAVVKAIDIKHQLEKVSNFHTNCSDRKQVIVALQLTREDLVRALKSDRILRENKNLLPNNAELLTNNLAALQTLQINANADEYGRLINQSWQISLTVQEEMRKLLNQR